MRIHSTQDPTWIRGEIPHDIPIPEQYELSIHVMWKGETATRVAVLWREPGNPVEEWFFQHGIFKDGGDAFKLLAHIQDCPQYQVLDYVRLAAAGILSKGEDLADVYRQDMNYEDISPFIELSVVIHRIANLNKDIQDRLLQTLIVCARQLDLEHASLADLRQKQRSVFQEWRALETSWVNEVLHCSMIAQQALGLLASLLNIVSPHSIYRVKGCQIWNDAKISENLEVLGKMLGVHGCIKQASWNETAMEELSLECEWKLEGDSPVPLSRALQKLPALLPPRLNLPFHLLAHLSAAAWVGFPGWRQQVDAKWSSPSDWKADALPLIWIQHFPTSQPEPSEPLRKTFIRRAIDTIKTKPHVDLLVLSLVVLRILLSDQETIAPCESTVVGLSWIIEGEIPANAHEILVSLLASLSRVLQDGNDREVLFLLTGPFDLTSSQTTDGADCDRMWEEYLRPSPNALVARPVELAQPFLRGVWIQSRNPPQVPGFYLVRQIEWFQEVAFAPAYLDEFRSHGGILTEESLPTQNAPDEIAPIVSQAINGIARNDLRCHCVAAFLQRYHPQSRACLEWAEALRILSGLPFPAKVRYLRYLVVAVAHLEHDEMSLGTLKETAGSYPFASDPITAKEVSGLMLNRELGEKANLLVYMLRLIGIASNANPPSGYTIGRIYMLLGVSLGIKRPAPPQLKTPEEIWQVVKSCKAIGGTADYLQIEDIVHLVHKVRWALPLPTMLHMSPSVLVSLTYNELRHFEAYRDHTLNQCPFNVGNDDALFLLWLRTHKREVVLNLQDSRLVDLNGKLRHRIVNGSRLEDALLSLLALSCLSRGRVNPTGENLLQSFESLLHGNQVSNSQEVISRVVSSMESILAESSSDQIRIFFHQHAKIGPSDPSAVQFWKHFAKSGNLEAAMKLANLAAEKDWTVVHLPA